MCAVECVSYMDLLFLFECFKHQSDTSPVPEYYVYHLFHKLRWLCALASMLLYPDDMICSFTTVSLAAFNSFLNYCMFLSLAPLSSHQQVLQLSSNTNYSCSLYKQLSNLIHLPSKNDFVTYAGNEGDYFEISFCQNGFCYCRFLLCFSFWFKILGCPFTTLAFEWASGLELNPKALSTMV